MDNLDTIATQYYLDDDVFDSAILLLMQEKSDGRKSKRGGSKLGRLPNKKRDFLGAHSRMIAHYFAPDAVYNEKDFRRRYRMSKRLFSKIMNAVQDQNSFFQQRADCRGKLGASTLQKVMASIKMLADGIAADSKDEYCQLAESTIFKCMREFCKSICFLYEDEFLRAPTSEDVERLTKMHGDRGFPGMLGSIDCMHWCWKNCPKA